ncbi:MAG: hypothetical protein U1E87_08270 [Alphaproteobacteria bacterium]
MALSGLAFLSFVAAATISDTRHAARLAVARAGRSRLRRSRAGIARAMLAIDEDWSAEAWPENGAPVPMAFGRGDIAVAIRDEAGKLDLSAAPDLMAGAVLSHAGITAERTRAILDALRKARSQAALARRTFSPTSLEELAAVIGLTREETEALRGLFITVHSGLGGFDEIVAAPALTGLIPGANAGAAGPGIAGPARANMANRPPSPSPAFTATSPRHMFTLRAEACTAGGHWVAREALVERRGSGDIRRLEVREPISPQLLTMPCAAHAQTAAATDH